MSGNLTRRKGDGSNVHGNGNFAGPTIRNIPGSVKRMFVRRISIADVLIALESESELPKNLEYF